VIGGSTDDLRCSRAGCRSNATCNVNWRNPRIHTPDRVKVWLACDEHAGFLRDYLDTRGFPVQLTPLGVVPDRVADDASQASTGPTA
jgi:hypothetical protein